MDLETPFDSHCSYSHIDRSMVEVAAASIVGTIAQIPPIYLAVKVKGARAYALARKGDRPKLHPRSIVIHSFSVFDINLPFIALNYAAKELLLYVASLMI